VPRILENVGRRCEATFRGGLRQAIRSNSNQNCVMPSHWVPVSDAPSTTNTASSCITARRGTV